MLSYVSFIIGPRIIKYQELREICFTKILQDMYSKLFQLLTVLVYFYYSFIKIYVIVIIRKIRKKEKKIKDKNSQFTYF